MVDYILQVRFTYGSVGIVTPYVDFIPYYVYDVEDGKTWQEIFDPTVATIFKTKKSAREWAEKNTTLAEYMVPVEYKGAVAAFSDWRQKFMIRRVLPIIDYSISRPYNGEDKYEILDWWWEYIHSNEDVIHQEDYESWPKLYSVFEHLWDFQSFINCDTNDRSHSIEVKVTRDSEFKNFKEELDLVLPRLDKYRNDEGDLYIGIFDRFLSEGGNSVKLVSHKDGKWSVVRQYSTIIENSTLNKCFKYLCRERYYED